MGVSHSAENPSLATSGQMDVNNRFLAICYDDYVDDDVDDDVFDDVDDDDDDIFDDIDGDDKS